MTDERRRSKRAPFLIEVNYEGGGQRAQTRISDIGTLGVFIDTLNPLPAGAKVHLNFTLPDGHRVEADGVVAHSQALIGMGVNFTSIRAEDVEHLRRLVSEDTPL